MDADYGNIIYFSEGRWLRWGKMLKRFHYLKNETKSFMESKRNSAPELKDEKWLRGLALLVDLTAHLNELNMCLQDENQLICAYFKS